MKAGDLIAFRNKKGLGSWLIRRLSYWTHIAIAVGDGFLLEATYKRGVHLSVASDRITQEKNRGMRVAVRDLDKPLTQLQKDRLELFINKRVGKPYERRWWHLVRAGLPLPKWLGGVSHSKGSFFCSELTADALHVLGILRGRHADSYDPTELFEESPGYRPSRDI